MNFELPEIKKISFLSEDKFAFVDGGPAPDIDVEGSDANEI